MVINVLLHDPYAFHNCYYRNESLFMMRLIFFSFDVNDENFADEYQQKPLFINYFLFSVINRIKYAPIIF